jgi:hypothetical protein
MVMMKEIYSEIIKVIEDVMEMVKGLNLPSSIEKLIKPRKYFDKHEVAQEYIQHTKEQVVERLKSFINERMEKENLNYLEERRQRNEERDMRARSLIKALRKIDEKELWSFIYTSDGKEIIKWLKQ